MRTSFPLALGPHPLHPAFAVVAAHGISDLDSWRWLPRYALCMLLPLPPAAVTVIFNLASVIHFANDLRVDGSIALHSLIGFFGVACGARCAERLMMVYLCCVHVPMHYARLLAHRRYVGAAMAVGFTLVMTLATRGWRGVCLSQTAQRVIVAHVWVEHSLAGTGGTAFQ